MEISFDLVPFPFLVFDSEYRLVFLNSKAKQTCRNGKSHVQLGQSVTDVFFLRGRTLDELQAQRQVNDVQCAFRGCRWQAVVQASSEEAKEKQYSVTLIQTTSSCAPDPSEAGAAGLPSSHKSPAQDTGNQIPQITSLDDILVKLEAARDDSSPEATRTILDELPHSIFTSSHLGELSFINKQFFIYTGLSEKDGYEMALWFTLFHRELTHLRPAKSSSFIFYLVTADDLAAAVAGYQTAIGSGQPLDITYRIKRGLLM